MNFRRSNLSPERYKQLQTSGIMQLLIYYQHKHINDEDPLDDPGNPDYQTLHEKYQQTTNTRRNASQMFVHIIERSTGLNDSERRIANLLQELQRFVDDMYGKPDKFMQRLSADDYDYYIGVLEILDEFAKEEQFLAIMKTFGAANIFIDIFVNLYQLREHRHNSAFKRILRFTSRILAQLTYRPSAIFEAQPEHKVLTNFWKSMKDRDYPIDKRAHFISAFFSFIQLDIAKNEPILEPLTHLLYILSSALFTYADPRIDQMFVIGTRIARKSRNPTTLKYVLGSLYWAACISRCGVEFFRCEGSLELLESLFGSIVPPDSSAIERNTIRQISYFLGYRLLLNMPESFSSMRGNYPALARQLWVDCVPVLLNIFQVTGQQREYQLQYRVLWKMYEIAVMSIPAREKMNELGTKKIVLDAWSKFDLATVGSFVVVERFEFNTFGIIEILDS